MLIYEHLTIQVDTNPIRLLNGLGFINSNTTCLLIVLVVSTRLLDLIKL